MRAIPMVAALVLVASSAAADNHACIGAQGDAKVSCERCVAETGGSSVPWKAPFGMEKDRPFLACRDRMVSERTELDALTAKLERWQPAVYEGAGAGIEGMSDQELLAAPVEAAAALARAALLAEDLFGTTVPTEKRDEAVREIGRLVAAERACRADKKCMAARAAKKADEEFRASVVAPMCQADQGREQATKDLAREKANPSGVVDLELLHGIGQAMQQYQAQFASWLPSYVKVRHHAWPGWRKECPEP